MGSNDTRNLMISIMAGVFATFLLYSYSQEKKAEYDKKFGTTKRVVVAKEDIQEMQNIYDTMLETVELPSQFIQPGAITIPEEAIGNVAAIPIKKGQAITKNSLLTPGPDTGIALQVAPSMRAVTIAVDDVRGVAKLIRPGDRVDIMVALDIGKGVSARREISTLLQDIPVLATGVSIVNNIPRVIEADATGKNLTQIALTGDTKYSNITVEVSPKDAQDLHYINATSPGNIYFSLRNPNDRTKQPRMPSSSSESVSGRPAISLDSGSAPTMAPLNIAPTRPMMPSLPPPRPSSKPANNNGGFRTL
jgi:pilus assembly protein CpaB